MDDQAGTWVAEHAAAVTEIGTLAPDATVVALGAATRGAREVYVLQDRLVRLLVAEHGYRTVALEEEWTTGMLLDAYVRTGEGDPAGLLAEMWAPWRTEEILDALRWLRAFNERHPDDPVRIMGMDTGRLRPVAYDQVTGHVRREAPERLAELEALYAPLRPDGDLDAHFEWYRALDGKRPLIDAAERARDLVADIGPGDRDGAGDRDAAGEALQYARLIVDFHRLHARPVMELLPQIEERIAANLLWWLDRHGGKIAYWGGLGHVAAADGLRTGAVTGAADRTSVGGHLRRALGARYAPVALTFGRGTVHGGLPVPPPPASFTDAVLDAAGLDEYLLDLRGGALPAAFTGPAKLRLIGPGYRPDDAAAHHMAGGSLAGWFDAVAHTREVTSAREVRTR